MKVTCIPFVKNVMACAEIQQSPKRTCRLKGLLAFVRELSFVCMTLAQLWTSDIEEESDWTSHDCVSSLHVTLCDMVV